jgi:hypothetical protein
LSEVKVPSKQASKLALTELSRGRMRVNLPPETPPTVFHNSLYGSIIDTPQVATWFHRCRLHGWRLTPDFCTVW